MDDMITKEEARYHEYSPEEQCKNCIMFKDGECSLVEGDIEEEGTCDYFEPK